MLHRVPLTHRLPPHPPLLAANGDVLAMHADGTHIASVARTPTAVCASGGPRVVVACPGLPTVELDPSAHSDAQKHSEGQRIAAAMVRTLLSCIPAAELCC
jgi:hypothetical protein